MADINYGPSNVYGNIPDVDSRGSSGQLGKFLRWNNDPIGNDATKLGEVNPALQRVVNRARADNPNLNFVIGNGLRSAADQDLAKSWGWSRVGSKDGGDALVHMNGNAVDLWGLDGDGRVQFNSGQQRQIAMAVKAAAQSEGVPLTWGGDWRTFKDAPHFELAGGGSAENAGAPEGHTTVAAPQSAPLGTTLNSNVIDTLAKNIAGIESGGSKNPYGLSGPNVAATGSHPAGNAIGKYQVMSYNVGPWTQQALGTSMTPEQFRNDPAAQEAVFRDQMTRTLAKNSPSDAASIWFTGKPFSAAGGSARDVLGTTNASYVSRATAGIPNAGALVPGTTINTTGGPSVGSQTGSPLGAPAPPAGGAAAGAQTGSPSGAPPGPAGGSPTVPGAWGSGQPPGAVQPWQQGLQQAAKTMGISSPFGGAGQDDAPRPPPLPMPTPPRAAGGPMMIGEGGQSAAGQQAARMALAQQGFPMGAAPANMLPSGAIMPPIGAGPPGAPPIGHVAPGQAGAMPAAGLPGTSLNSPSQLQMAMLYGMQPGYGGMSGSY